MSAAAVPLIISILQILANAEPEIIQAVHNLLTGTGTASDLAILGADALVWQSIADKAAAEIAKVKPSTPPTGTPIINPAVTTTTVTTTKEG
jgi:hypothetical protein